MRIYSLSKINHSKMDNKNKTKDILFKIAAIFIVLATIYYSFNPVIASYIMIGASAIYIICVFTSRYMGESLRGKRLYNINVFGAILMGVSSYLMYRHDRLWALLLFIAAILTIYATLMLSKVIKEDSQK